MGLFRRKSDPIAESERQLNAKIAALEGEIRALHSRLDTSGSRARPHPIPSGPAANPSPPQRPDSRPAFEAVSHHPVQIHSEAETTAAHYNDLGVRKYDVLAICRRWFGQLRGGATANPKLVNYLAAGSIHGLRPLRYEKRIARNRFLALCVFFLAILWGLIYIYFRNR